MTYRSVLVEVDGERGSRLRIEAAARIASDNDASLTGVWLRSEIMPGVMMAEGIVAPVVAADAFLNESRALTAAAASKVRAPFDAEVSRLGLRANWASLNGDHPDALIAHARRHDLTILPCRMKPAFGSNEIRAEQIAMQSGGPVLVMPPSGFPPNFGRKILVGWKESREVARVLRDAWPFLAAAAEVHFLTAAQDDRGEMDGLLETHLEAHGCRAVFFRVDRDTALSTAEIIRRHTAMVGADMLVLGLYGRPRLAELALGGVSRSLVNHPPMPILFSH